ncbi:MAG TPA: ABC transporter transmembrane domain-containing protein, partial [Acidimicrobiia bacterium]|nr:ABC transporter transmembrane domain-containing protein [Acidimicrobiia bacterium]
MSTPPAMKPTERIQAHGGPGRGGPFGGGMVGQKALDFGPSARRLGKRLGPERGPVIAVFVLGVVSVALSAVGPKVLGRATDLIFAGLVGRRLPAGISKEQAIEAARAQGQGRIADLLSGVDVVPGQGVDLRAVGQVLLVVLALYIGSALLAFLQGYLLNGAVQRTIFRMRSDIEDKLNRLPLRYFDRQPRGELLSRVTN